MITSVDVQIFPQSTTDPYTLPAKPPQLEKSNVKQIEHVVMFDYEE